LRIERQSNIIYLLDTWVEEDVVDQALVATVEAKAYVAEFEAFRLALREDGRDPVGFGVVSGFTIEIGRSWSDGCQYEK